MSDVKILELVDRVKRTALEAQEAHQVLVRMRESYRAAEIANVEAEENYSRAQNALLVAAGGRDRSFLWGGGALSPAKAEVQS